MSFQRLVRETVYIKELVLGNLSIVPPGEISGFVVENKGDLITTEDGNILTAITRGIDGQVLQANELSDNGMAWTTVTPAPPILSVNGETGVVIFTIDDVNVMTNKGDIMVDQGGPNVVRLGIGANGQFLIADSTVDTGVKWSNDAPFDIVSVNGKTGAVVITMNDITPALNKGDLITADGANTQRLPVGLNDYYLIADSSNPLGMKWDTRPDFDVSSVNGKDNGTIIITIDDVSPASGKGDLITADIGNIATALPVGANGSALTADSLNSLGLTYTSTPNLSARTISLSTHTYPSQLVNITAPATFDLINYGTGSNLTTGFDGYYISSNFPVTTVGPTQGQFIASTDGYINISLYMNLLANVIPTDVTNFKLNIIKNGDIGNPIILSFIDILNGYAKLVVNSLSMYLLKNEYISFQLEAITDGQLIYNPGADSNSIAVFNIAMI